MTDPNGDVPISGLVLGNSPGSEKIEEMLRSRAKKSLTQEEIRAQRLSFVMGMLPHDSTMTRARVQEILDSHYG